MSELNAEDRVRVVNCRVFNGIEGTIVDVELDDRDIRNRDDIHWVYSPEFKHPDLKGCEMDDGLRWFYDREIKKIDPKKIT